VRKQILTSKGGRQRQSDVRAQPFPIVCPFWSYDESHRANDGDNSQHQYLLFEVYSHILSQVVKCIQGSTSERVGFDDVEVRGRVFPY
jgi:hypothetical protein